MPRSHSPFTVSKLNKMLDLADFPEVGAAIRATVRNIVREVFDMDTLLRYQDDKWTMFRERLVETFPPLQAFPHRIETLQEYARKYAFHQISQTRKLSPVSRSRLTNAVTARDVDIELGAQILDQHSWSLIILPTSSSIHLIECDDY